MGVRQNMKKLWNKIRKNGKKTIEEFKEDLDKLGRADAEISVEEVVETEIYPSGKRTRPASELEKNTRATVRSSGDKPAVKKRGKLDKTGTDVVKNVKKNAAKKPAKKRTRPTNENYRMIDTDDNSADTSKS